MKAISEQDLWEFIDGTLTPQRAAEVAAALAQNGDLQQRYTEFVELNDGLGDLGTDEPPMRFARRVSERLAAETIPPAFRFYRIVKYSIGGFFILSISVLLIFTFFSVDWHIFSEARKGTPAFDFSDINPSLLKALLYADLIAALYLADRLLRKKLMPKAAR